MIQLLKYLYAKPGRMLQSRLIGVGRGYDKKADEAEWLNRLIIVSWRENGMTQGWYWWSSKCLYFVLGGLAQWQRVRLWTYDWSVPKTGGREFDATIFQITLHLLTDYFTRATILKSLWVILWSVLLRFGPMKLLRKLRKTRRRAKSMVPIGIWNYSLNHE